MKITFDCPDKINGVMTMVIEPTDYQEKVEKTLKDYRKKAQVPGFRPGQVPMGMIKRQYGTAAKVDEVNRLISEKLYGYIQENKIQMLGEPLPNQEKQKPQDFEKEGDLEFVFDIAVAPEMKAELTDKDKLTYYDIKVDDKLIDDQVQVYASQAGEFKDAETFSGNDTLTGALRELDQKGNTKEDGLSNEAAMIMPAYIKEDKQRKLFDRVFGEGTVKDEKAFREKIAETIKPQLQGNSDYKFLIDLRAYMEKKVGEVAFPEALLKRVMLQNNKDKDADYVEKNFEGSIKELKWHLIKEQLVAANQIKVEDADVKAVAKDAIRQQFAQYGMSNVPDDVLENYAAEQLKKRENIDGFVDRAVDQKLVETLKTVVKLTKKEVSLEDFNKTMQEK